MRVVENPVMRSIGLAAVALVFGFALPGSAAKKVEESFQYRASYLCGEAVATIAASLRGGVRPGRYATAITVHNPYDEAIQFSARRSISFPVAEGGVISGSPIPGPVSFLLDWNLSPHESVMIDCDDLKDFQFPPQPPILAVGPTPSAGSISVESAWSLDVGVVYTSGQNDAETTSISTQEVKERVF